MSDKELRRKADEAAAAAAVRASARQQRQQSGDASEMVGRPSILPVTSTQVSAKPQFMARYEKSLELDHQFHALAGVMPGMSSAARTALLRLPAPSVPPPPSPQVRSASRLPIARTLAHRPCRCVVAWVAGAE